MVERKNQTIGKIMHMIVNNEELKMIKASSTWTGALD
jgi:hypothetical protein